MSIVVLRGGLQTTIQDLGRPGMARIGVPEGGALDPVALRIANMLVGNRRDVPGLELTIEGPHLLFERATTIAICGADMSPTCNGVLLPQWRAIHIEEGATLQFGTASHGARAYVAVAGGCQAAVVLGGRGTNLVGCFGGIDGRQLRAGDRIGIGDDDARGAHIAARVRVDPREMQWSVDPTLRTATNNEAVVRVIETHAYARFISRILDQTFTVSAVSDRMGIRLNESIATHDESIVSEPTVIGAIQLPPDGCPMILMNDHQTLGGYPIIAHVATVDLPLLGQMRPGATLRFMAIDVDRAQTLLCAREHELRSLEMAIELRRNA